PTPALAEATSEPPVPVPDRVAHEASLGTSLAHVSLHTGPAARAALDEVGAEGATIGHDVLLRQAPAPGSAENEAPARAALAHELAHAAPAAPAAPVAIPRPDVEPAAERAAAALAESVEAFHRPARAARVERRDLERAQPATGTAALLR